jgi:hypothetical protein
MDFPGAFSRYTSHPFCFVRRLSSPGEIARALGVAIPELIALNPSRTRGTVIASGTMLALPKTFDVNQRLHSKKVDVFPSFFLVDSSSWFPPRPAFAPLGANGRISTFGSFEFEDDPKHAGAIHILGDWAKKNVGPVHLPQLAGVRAGSATSGRTSGGRVEFFKRGANQLRALFNAWEAAGVLGAIQTWNGSFVPRYKRNHTRGHVASVRVGGEASAHSMAALSNHAWGTAFDINAQWNKQKVPPARQGETGCLLELVEIANQHGFYWGGHFSGAGVDGMHFEIARLMG